MGVPRRARRAALIGAALAALALTGCDDDSSSPPVDATTSTTASPSGVAVGETATVSFAVNVCGEWLSPAPEFAADVAGSPVGLHSDGQGNIVAEPGGPAEAGENATLALFLSSQGWEAGELVIRVWDGETHVAGRPCPDGRPGEVRWTLDGEEQTSDPSLHVLDDGQAIVLAFVAEGDPFPHEGVIRQEP